MGFNNLIQRLLRCFGAPLFVALQHSQVRTWDSERCEAKKVNDVLRHLLKVGKTAASDLVHV